MRVFVTGATGFVGSAVVKELLSGGHNVLGLARSDAGAAALKAAGAEARHGTLDDLDGLAAGARACDAVAHLAFNHEAFRDSDFLASFTKSCEMDRRAIEALGGALVGTDKPMLVTSGLALLAEGRPANEDDKPRPNFPRASEAAAEALVAHGVKASSVRLSPTTHGDGDHGFVPMLINIARQKGVSAYVGEGLNRWPAVHRFDAARIFRLALERPAAGLRYHAVAEEGVPFKEIATVIGKHLGLPVVSIKAEEADAHFGWFAMFAQMDLRATAEKTRKRLDWQPTGPGLIADMEAHYFKS